MRSFASRNKKAILGLVFLGFIGSAAFLLSEYGMMFDFYAIKEARMDIEMYLMDNILKAVVLFGLIYIVAITFSLPVATPLSILSGFLFGPLLGTAIVSVSATTGASISFLLSRFFFRDYVEAKWGEKIKLLNDEFKDHGFRGVLLLRFALVIPFPLVNMGTALTSVKLRDFVLATWLGTLPFTFIYAKAGMQLGEIDMVSDIISLPVILSVTALALLVAAPIIVQRLRSRRGTKMIDFEGHPRL